MKTIFWQTGLSTLIMKGQPQTFRKSLIKKHQGRKYWVFPFKTLSYWESLFLALVIFSASFVSQPAWSGAQVWDFKDAGQEKDWQVANGTWKIQDGVYSETSAAESAMHSLAGDENWEDYTLEGKVKLDGNYAGLVFRALNEFEYYVFYLELVPQPRNLCFFKHTKGAFDQRERPQPNKTDISGEKLERGEWIEMKIVVEGNKFNCFLNGKEICEGTDNLGNEYPKGKVGVWAWQTKASFDDITVSGPDILGAAVDRQNKLAITWGELKGVD